MSRNDGRDENGRWKKGFCPNPKGRPRKKTEFSEADFYIFKNKLVSANVNGEPQRMSRHELLMHASYELAVKGKSVSLAKMLLQRFEKSDDTVAEAKDYLRELGREVVEHYERTGELPEKRMRLYQDLYLAVTGRDFDEDVYASAPPRDCSNWRKGPKPQAILDLEKEWAAEEEADDEN